MGLKLHNDTKESISPINGTWNRKHINMWGWRSPSSRHVGLGQETRCSTLCRSVCGDNLISPASRSDGKYVVSIGFAKELAIFSCTPPELGHLLIGCPFNISSDAWNGQWAILVCADPFLPTIGDSVSPVSSRNVAFLYKSILKCFLFMLQGEALLDLVFLLVLFFTRVLMIIAGVVSIIDHKVGW